MKKVLIKNGNLAEDLLQLINEGKYILTMKRIYFKERGQYYSELIRTGTTDRIPSRSALLDILEAVQRTGYRVENSRPQILNPAKRKTMRERCEEIIHGKEEAPSYSYYRSVENTNNNAALDAEIERVKIKIIILKDEIAELKRREQFNGIALGSIYRPLQRKRTEHEIYLEQLLLKKQSK